MNIKSWDDTWGTIDWQNDCKTKIKKRINEFYNAGVNFDIRDNKGDRVPLHYAAEYCAPDVVTLLMSCGSLTALRAKDDWAALHFAVRGNKPENVSSLLKYSVKGIENLKDKWGRTALDMVAHDGRTDIVKILCDFNPNLINKQNNYGWTALHHAASLVFVDIARYLIESGADLSVKTNNGKTALYYATASNWHDGSIIRMLIENAKDLTGENEALEWAVMNNDKEMTKKLIECGVDVNVKNEYGEAVIEKANTTKIKRLIKNAAKIRADYLAIQQIEPKAIAKHNDDKVNIDRQYQ